MLPIKIHNASPARYVQHHNLQPIRAFLMSLVTPWREIILSQGVHTHCRVMCKPMHPRQHGLQHLCSRPANDHTHNAQSGFTHSLQAHTRTHTCDPWQHGLQHLCSRPADDHAHDVLLLFHSEVLVEERPQLVLLRSHVLLQGGSHGSAHALQLTGVLTQLLQAAAGLNPVEHLP